VDDLIKLQWSALEYEDKQRSADWFWALAVVVVTIALAAIIFSNYFFATLIILSGALLWFFAIKEPDTVYYELNDKGLKIRNRLYLYENILSFWVQHDPKQDGLVKPILFVRSERAVIPVITVPIPNDLAMDIRDAMLSKNVPEEEMKEHVAEKVMDYLGF
jgi:hypothetical protein